MPDDIPVSDKVKKSFSALSEVSSVLNASSDRLSNNITALEAQLKKVSLGVSSFEIFDDRLPHSDGMFYDVDKIGYCKINGKWGFAIETMAGREDEEGHRNYELWPFNEAPRAKRVKAVKAIPALLDRLARDAASMVDDVDAGSDFVEEITRALAAPKTTSLGALMKGDTVFTPEQLKEMNDALVVASDDLRVTIVPGSLAGRRSPGAKK